VKCSVRAYEAVLKTDDDPTLDDSTDLLIIKSPYPFTINSLSKDY
jgi:hypothetical protein